MEWIEGLYPWVQKILNPSILSHPTPHGNTSTDGFVTSQLPRVPTQPWSCLEELPIPGLIPLLLTGAVQPL